MRFALSADAASDLPEGKQLEVFPAWVPHYAGRRRRCGTDAANAVQQTLTYYTIKENIRAFSQ
jgi:hypothetical protein